MRTVVTILVFGALASVWSSALRSWRMALLPARKSGITEDHERFDSPRFRPTRQMMHTMGGGVL